jgi:outer membrane lipoprotein SlyB
MRPAQTLLPLLFTLTLAGCATETASVASAGQPEACAVREVPTGTMIVKREPCIETTEAERAQARRQTELMRDEQLKTVRRPTTPTGN